MRAYYLLLLLICLTRATSAQAGAWLQPEGHGLFIGQASYYTTDRYFDGNGTLKSQPRFSKYELQPYAEYGAREWLTVGGSAYAQSVVQSGTTNYGLADPELFARMRLYRSDRAILSVQPLVKLSSHFQDTSPPRGGSKSTDAELSALYGRNLRLISDRDYVDTRIGYRLRNNGLGDQWRGDVALGLGISDRIQLVPALRGILTPNRADASTFAEGGDLDYDMLKAELTGVYHLDASQWLQASVFTHIAGAQTGDGEGISIGYAQRF